MLNDLLIKFWIITFINSQNVTNYARRFKTTMQNIRRMIIYVSINDNLFILYFHLSLDAKFEQYREHYAQTHEIVSNESNLIKTSIKRSIDFWIFASIARSRKNQRLSWLSSLSSQIHFSTKFNQTRF
jgi:hypothetical protein